MKINNDKMITEGEIYRFLQKVDDKFPTPLSKKQDLKCFSKKLFEKATVVVKHENEEIVAMVAGYTENIVDNIAYITILATLECARGKGYAKGIIEDFFEICKSKKIKAVHLYAAPSNIPAVNLYKKIGFVQYKIENEPRKEDLHLIYYFDK